MKIDQVFIESLENGYKITIYPNSLFQFSHTVFLTEHEISKIKNIIEKYEPWNSLDKNITFINNISFYRCNLHEYGIYETFTAQLTNIFTQLYVKRNR